MKCIQIFVLVFRNILSFSCVTGPEIKKFNKTLVCVVHKTSKDTRYKNSVITLTAETQHVSHHNDVTSAPWRLESPITRLIVEQLFSPTTKNIIASHYWALCEGKPPVTGGFPSQKASNAGNILS